MRQSHRATPRLYSKLFSLVSQSAKWSRGGTARRLRTQFPAGIVPGGLGGFPRGSTRPKSPE